MLPGGACEACQGRIMELGDVMAKLSDAEAELENRSQELTKLQQVCLFSHLLYNDILYSDHGVLVQFKFINYYASSNPR